MNIHEGRVKRHLKIFKKIIFWTYVVAFILFDIFQSQIVQFTSFLLQF